ncbi:MAG: cdhA 1, partial [Cryobacterium sp.]|nr:cdhA 1 [Cryobacterium sp.]
MPLEARASHVSLDAATGRVTLHTTTQMPHVVRTGICDTLGFSEDMLRVVAPDVGGGFGAKMCLAREDVALVAIARATRQDLAWIETREENFLGAWHSREQTYKLAGSFKPDGELVALEARIFADVGAYSCYPVTFGVEALMGLNELSGPYRFQHFSGHSQSVLTNKCPVAPYRGVSRPVFTMALERLMDEAADELDIDRLSIRLKNVVTEYPHHSPTGVVLDAASHAEAIELTRTLTSSDALAEEQRAASARGNLVGQGYAVFSESSGFGTSAFAARKMEITLGYERVNLALDPSGNALLRIGASPHGQGLQTSLAQLVADEIGVMPDHVRVIHSDTDATPYGWGTFASRSMVIAGGASKIAAEKVAKQIKEIAAGLFECAPDDVVLSRGDATVRGTQQTIPVSTIARHAYHSSHLLPAGFEQGIEASGNYDPDGTYSNSVHIADVEVDPRTGAARILRYVVVEDAGRLINPAIVDGQIRGGVAQGIGNALFEELLYDDIGNLTTTTLMDFLPPTIAEMPDVEIHHLETISDFTITGAKGVGEGGTMGAPAAIVSAINDALRSSGARIDRVPATPQRIRHAIRSAHEQSA